jgi:hypothetical protein
MKKTMTAVLCIIGLWALTAQAGVRECKDRCIAKEDACRKQCCPNGGEMHACDRCFAACVDAHSECIKDCDANAK